jgi:hypothetical protein
MMAIDITGVDKLAAFADMDLNKRMLAIKTMILREFVTRLYKDIKDAIPDTETWMQIYKKSMKIYKMSDLDRGDDEKGEIGYAIASKVTGDWSMVDAGHMVVYFGPAQYSPDASIGKILEKFSPFAVNQIPRLSSYGSTVLVRRVREEEVEEVTADNQKKRDELAAALKEQGADILEGPAKIGGVVYFDIYFAVMRMELGYDRRIRAPHWKPVLRGIKLYLSRLMQDGKIMKRVKEYFRPKNTSHSKEFKVKLYDEIRMNRIGQFKHFQKEIRPRFS